MYEGDDVTAGSIRRNLLSHPPPDRLSSYTRLCELENKPLYQKLRVTKSTPVVVIFPVVGSEEKRGLCVSDCDVGVCSRRRNKRAHEKEESAYILRSYHLLSAAAVDRRRPSGLVRTVLDVSLDSC